jgi:tetratricopeptide (TPR) repeat protein
MISGLESQIKSDPYNPLHHIALARAYLEQGDEERARKIIAIKRRLPSNDHTVHFEWGRLSEEIGMARQARESYEQAIALNPNSGDYHWRIARLLYEGGAWERALKHLQKTVVLLPQSVEAKEMLSSLYREMGFTGSARSVSRKKETADSISQKKNLILSEKDVLPFMDLFKGKEVGFARYQFNKSGNLGHVFVNKPIGINEVIRHLMGEESFGIYPLRTDRTLKFSIIRVRMPWRRIIENIKNSGFLAITEDKAHHYARRVVERVKGYGVSAYLEKPGRFERRIWFFFNEFIPHEMAKRFLNVFIDRVGAPGVDLAIDALVGLKGAGVGWEEFPIMLPLGVNPRIGERCFFLNDEDGLHEDQLLFIQKIRTISRNEIMSFLRSGAEFKETARGAYESGKRLERACPVIGEIVRKACSGRNLRNEEKMVLYFSLKFLMDGDKMIHQVLENCPDYRPGKVNRILSRLKGNPISCPKVRQLLPETTAYLSCNCSFVIPEGSYPSPLFHLDSGLAPAKRNVKDERRTIGDEQKTLEDNQQPIYEINDRYQFVCNEIERFTKEKGKLEVMMRMLNEAQ